MSKYGMVLNLDRCIGCYACVVACKMCYGTRPGVNYNAVNKVEYGEGADARQRYVLTMCMHCDAPPCVDVCPTGATWKTEEGPVVIDYEACIGCGACVNACPYDARHLVEDDETSFEGSVAPYEEESSKRLNVAEKCTFCYERVKEGQQPMCTVFCPGQCRIFGDVEDPESDISKYIAERGAVNIEGTSIWYVVPEGMDRSVLPKPLAELVGTPTGTETTTAAGEPAETTAAGTNESFAASAGANESATTAAAPASSGESGSGIDGGMIGILGGSAAVLAGAAVALNVKNKKEKTADQNENKGGKGNA